MLDYRVVGCMFVCLLGVASSVDGQLTAGYYEYKYSLQRQLLEEKEKEFAGHPPPHYTQNETIVDNYMEYLKWAEFQKTRDAFPPARPVHDVLDKIKASEIYRVLKKFPKGGNMHLHQNHVLSKRKMLDLIFNSSLLNVLCVNNGDARNKWKLGFYITPPKNWVRVKDNLNIFSKDTLLQHISMIKVLSNESRAHPTDSNLRWKDLGPMFGKAGTNLALYQNYTRMHIQAMLKSAVEENVQYLEARVSPLGMYVLDDTAPGGHRVIDHEGDLWFKTVTEEINKFKADNPGFIGYSEIVQGGRYRNHQMINEDIAGVFRLRQKFPDLVRGYDLVSEEDNGYSLLFHVDSFVDMMARNETIPLYFHTAETSWPDDLKTSELPMDPVGTLNNVYEAIILGSKRVGHGIGFINHPYLMQLLKERNIALEANPVSNMLLGYVTDQRHHPAASYFRYGVPVVLGADDPGTMGYDEFTVDWYEVFMAWGLRLEDLRTLAMNSLNYSTMSINEKQSAFSKYNSAWNVFISEMAAEACGADLATPAPEVESIYPREGHKHVETTVKIFGRHFQSAICQKIICRFGNQESIGRYVYNYMITCDTPRQTGNSQTVDFSISLDSGQTFLNPANLTFSYVHDITKHDKEISSIFVG